MNTINKRKADTVELLCSQVLRDASTSQRRLRDVFTRYFGLNDELRFYVMHRISGARTRVARRLLVEILCKDPSILVRHEAVFALGWMGDVDDLPHVRRALRQDKNSLVRHEAAMALGTMGRPQDIRALRFGLRDDDPMVVQSCRAAITLIRLRQHLAG